jgi:Plavaka transposase
MHSAMLVPIILGSDKTTVSIATGQNDYYPLYLSIGNIHNNTCCAHQNGLILLAFLAIPKSMFMVVSCIVFVILTLVCTSQL